MRMPATIVLLLLSVQSVKPEDDPEAYMGVFDTIKRWGYPAELYDVITKDGYILDLFRIPHGRFSETNSSCLRPAILLAHGLAAGSSCWVLNPPESSPAFLLADTGFDVFLLNNRGTTYGKRHTFLNPWDNKFWQFTLDELVKYDATATIDKVLELTGQKGLYWVGHSQGTATGFMLLADIQEYNKKVKGVFQLGPLATGSYIRGVVRFVKPIIKLLKPVADFYRVAFGSHEAAWQWGFIYRPLVRLCEAIPYIGPVICQKVPLLMFGASTHPLNLTRTPVYLSHIPSGTSTWNALHWAQMVDRMKVEHMDHNPLENIQRYGQETAPPYNYSNIESPIYLYWSRADWMTTAEEIDHLLMKLLRKGAVKGGAELQGYDHADFVVAPEIAEDIFKPITHIVRSQEKNMCLK